MTRSAFFGALAVACLAQPLLDEARTRPPRAKQHKQGKAAKKRAKRERQAGRAK